MKDYPLHRKCTGKFFEAISCLFTAGSFLSLVPMADCVHIVWLDSYVVIAEAYAPIPSGTI